MDSTTTEAGVIRFLGMNKSFMQTLWFVSFPGLIDLPDDLASDLASWLNSDKLGSAIARKEGRARHTVGQNIDVITKGSGKMQQLERCLQEALEDREQVAGQPALKKHTCVLVSRPGLGLIIAAYTDKHWEAKWNVVMARSGAIEERRELIVRAFPDIPIESWEKPTLLIATVGTCGTGLDYLKKVNHAILFDLPFIEVVRTQARGRFWRSGQQFICHWTELWAEDSQAESLIKDRHDNRTMAFSVILARQDGEGRQV